jgi:hypothetical protein
MNMSINGIHQPTLNKILENNERFRPQDVKNVLVLHEEPINHIGDWAIAFDKLKYLKTYMPDAAVTINFTVEGANKIYDALLKNNPHLDAITTRQWKDIDLEKYDLLFTYSYNEPPILAWLHETYGQLIQSDQYKVCVYTFSHGLVRADPNAIPIFPVNQEFFAHAKNNNVPPELYLSKEEQQWANEWLREKGLKENEQLFIVLDATQREKLLSMQVHFQFLMNLLKRENIKVLIFDENNLGKDKFYTELIGARLMEKFIFCKGLSLRQAFCLLGSSYTKLVFGPCTGLMHCASGIYNNYLNNGLEREKLPVLITYTGKYHPDAKTVHWWWSNAPLVNVLALRMRNNQKTMLLLEEMEDFEKKTNSGLLCSEYTVSMLTEFLDKKLPYKLTEASQA